MRKWPAQVGTVVANVGRELSLLKMAINKANADYLLFFLWNELEPRFQQRTAGCLELGSRQFHIMEPVPDHQMSHENLFGKMILKLIAYFTQLI